MFVQYYLGPLKYYSKILSMPSISLFIFRNSGKSSKKWSELQQQECFGRSRYKDINHFLWMARVKSDQDCNPRPKTSFYIFGSFCFKEQGHCDVWKLSDKLAVCTECRGKQVKQTRGVIMIIDMVILSSKLLLLKSGHGCQWRTEQWHPW